MTDPTPITERTGVKCALRYLYEQPHKDPILIECFRESESSFYMSAGLNDNHADVVVKRKERDLGSGCRVQYKPDCVDRHYYETLQKACEGAVKTLRRAGELE
jgi:hypothetical protein